MQILRALAVAALAAALGACASQGAPDKVAAAGSFSLAPASDAEIAESLALIEKAPEAPTGYVQLGATYVRRARATGDFALNAKAEAAVDKALALAPEDVPARKLKASLHLTFHRFAEALAAGEKLQREFPNDPFVYGVLTDANVELGRYREAVDAAQKMVDLKPNSNSYARVAHLRSLYGDTNGAVEMFKTAARTADPADREAQGWCLVQLGDELWKYGRYAAAEKVYDEALGVFPGYHLALAGKGRARAAQNDPDGAIRLLTDAQNRVPAVEPAILLGDLYAARGDADKARAQYALVEVIESRIGVSNDRKRLALLWADRGERLDEALAIALGEFDLRKDIYTADALAWTLYKKGRFADAKQAIAAALAPPSNDARILYHAGMIEKELGNRAAAKKLLADALEKNPMFDPIQSENARRALAELK